MTRTTYAVCLVSIPCEKICNKIFHLCLYITYCLICAALALDFRILSAASSILLYFSLAALVTILIAFCFLYCCALCSLHFLFLSLRLAVVLHVPVIIVGLIVSLLAMLDTQQLIV